MQTESMGFDFSDIINKGLGAGLGNGIHVDGPKVEVDSPIEVHPKGPIDYGPVYDGLDDGDKRKPPKVKVPVEVELTTNEKDIVKQIKELLNKKANWKDYRHEGGIDQAWFDNAVKKLKRTQSGKDILSPTQLRSTVKSAHLLNGIINKNYKPKNSIDTSGADLDLIKKVLSQDFIDSEIGKYLKSGGYNQRQSLRGGFAATINIDTAEARKQLGDLEQSLRDVEKAVDDKTQAFQREHDNVVRNIQDEVDIIQRLNKSVGNISLRQPDNITNATQQNITAIKEETAAVEEQQKSIEELWKTKALNKGAVNFLKGINDGPSGPRDVAQRIHKQDRSDLVNEILQFDGDQLNIDKTLEAVRSFKTTIGELSDAEVYSQLNETAKKMLAYDDVLNRLKEVGTTLSDEDKEFKLSQNTIEKRLKQIRSEITVTQNQLQKEEKQKRDEENARISAEKLKQQEEAAAALKQQEIELAQAKEAELEIDREIEETIERTSQAEEKRQAEDVALLRQLMQESENKEHHSLNLDIDSATALQKATNQFVGSQKPNASDVRKDLNDVNNYLNNIGEYIQSVKSYGDKLYAQWMSDANHLDSDEAGSDIKRSDFKAAIASYVENALKLIRSLLDTNIRESLSPEAIGKYMNGIDVYSGSIKNIGKMFPNTEISKFASNWTKPLNDFYSKLQNGGLQRGASQDKIDSYTDKYVNKLLEIIKKQASVQPRDISQELQDVERSYDAQEKAWEAIEHFVQAIRERRQIQDIYRGGVERKLKEDLEPDGAPDLEVLDNAKAAIESAKQYNVGEGLIEKINASAEKATKTVSDLFSEIEQLYSVYNTSSGSKNKTRSLRRNIYAFDALTENGFDTFKYQKDLNEIKSDIGYEDFDLISNKSLQNTVDRLVAPIRNIQKYTDELTSTVNAEIENIAIKEEEAEQKEWELSQVRASIEEAFRSTSDLLDYQKSVTESVEQAFEDSAKSDFDVAKFNTDFAHSDIREAIIEYIQSILKTSFALTDSDIRSGLQADGIQEGINKVTTSFDTLQQLLESVPNAFDEQLHSVIDVIENVIVNLRKDNIVQNLSDADSIAGKRKELEQVFLPFINRINQTENVYKKMSQSVATKTSQSETSHTPVLDVNDEVKAITVLENKLKTDIPAAVTAKNKAFEDGRELVEKTVSAEIEQVKGLETELSVNVPEAVQKKTDAFNQELSDVSGYVDKEIDKLKELGHVIGNDIPQAVDTKTRQYQNGAEKVNETVNQEAERLKDVIKDQVNEPTPKQPELSSAANSYHNIADDAERRADAEERTARATKEQSTALDLIHTQYDFGDKPGKSTPRYQDNYGDLGTLISNIYRYGRQGSLDNIFNTSEKIIGGEFNYSQLKSFRLKAQPLLELLTQLSADKSDLQKVIAASREGADDGKLYEAWLQFKSELNRVIDILSKTAENAGKIGDVQSLWTQPGLAIGERAHAILETAYMGYSDYHSSSQRGDIENDIKQRIRSLASRSEKYAVQNALNNRGLLSSKGVDDLKYNNKKWEADLAVVENYLANAVNVSDEIQKLYKTFQEKLEFATNELAPIKVAASNRKVTDQEQRVLDAIADKLKISDSYLSKEALKREDLLNPTKEDNFAEAKVKWDEYGETIGNYLSSVNKVGGIIPEQIQKALTELSAHIEKVNNEVIPAAIDLAETKARDPKAQTITGKSKKAKVYEAYRKLSDPKAEYEYQRSLLFEQKGLLSNDQIAKLNALKAEHERNEDLIKDYKLEDEYIQSLARNMNKVVAEAKDLADQALFERTGESNNNDLKNLQELLDMQYRMINFQQKRDTVGVTDLELAALDEASAKYHELYNQLDSIKDRSNAVKKALESVNKKEKEVSTQLSRKWSDMRDRRYGSFLNEGDTAEYHTRNDVEAGLQRYVNRNGAKQFELFDGKAVGNIKKYRAEILNTDGTIEKLNLTLNTTKGQLFSVQSGVKSASSFFEQFSEGLKRRAINLAQYAMTFASLRTAIQAFRAAINNIRDLDSAFVELSRISHDSSSALEEFRKKSFDVADQVGSTAAQVINSAAQWEHLGYNVKEAGELAKVSSIYKNIADGMSSDSEATEDLVAIMKAYGFQANQAIDVTDALIAVSNNYAVTAADIGNALKRSASAMSVANNTFEQNVALATAMAEVTQNAEKSGSALQVLSLRIRGAKTELQEMGEDTDDMASSTSKLRAQVKGLTKGFDIMKDDKTFKQTYDIMKGIAAVWKDLDDISRASLLETLAGKVRANQVAALLDNFSQAEKVLQTIAQDEGTAIANNEAKLNTIEARITKFRNATQHLTADIFQPELIKTVIDGGTKIVNLLDSMVQRFGALSPLFAVLGGATTFNGGGIIGGFNEWRKKRRDSKKPITFSDEQIEGITYLKNNGLLTKEKIELLQGYDNKQKDALNLMAEEGLDIADAIKEVGESAQEGGGFFDLFREKGVKAFGAIGMALGNAAISVGIQLALSTAIKLINEFLTVQQRLSESAKNFGTQIKSTNSDLDSYKSKIAEQRAIIEDNKSSIEDVTTARSTLYELQKQMIDAYGIEKDAIKEIADAFDGQTQAIDRNIEKLKERQYQDAVDKYNEENKSIFLPKQKNVLDENGVTYTFKEMTPYDYFLEKMEQHQESLYQFMTDVPPELKDVYDKHAKKNGWDDPTKAIGHVDQFLDFFDDYLDTLNALYNSTDQNITEGQYNKLSNLVLTRRAPVKSTSESGRDLYNQEQLHQLRTGIYSDTYEYLNQLYANYTKAKTKEAQDEIIQAYSNAINEIKNSGDFSYGFAQALEGLHPDLYTQVSKWEFEFKLKGKLDEGETKNEIQKAINELQAAVGDKPLTREMLDNWNDSAHDSAQNSAYLNYTRALYNAGTPQTQYGNEMVAQQGMISTENIEAFKDKVEQIAHVNFDDLDQNLLATIKDVDQLEKKFQSAWRKIGKQVPDGAKKVETAIQLIAREEEKTKQSLEELDGMDLSDVAKHLSKLNDVYDKLKKDGEVKWNTIDTKDFKEAFGDIKDETGDFQKAWDNFHKTLSSTPNDAKAVQDAFDIMASAYVYNSECMSLLNENNKDLVIGMLSDNGVVNATEVVNDALARKAEAAQYDAFSEDLLAQKSINLANVSGESATATLEGAVAFLDSANYAEQDQAAIAKLILEQWALNGSHIDTSDSCNALQDLAAMAGVAAGQIIALNNAMAGGTGGVPAGMSADEWDQVYDKEAYFKHEQERRQQETLEQVRGAREKIRLGGGGGGSSSGGGGGGGGGGNKEPSKTDKEFDYVNRYLQILQEQNEELREKVDNQYVILQDAEDNAEEFSDAIGRLGEAEQELNSLGVYYGEDEFTEFLETLDLSEAAENVTSNVDEIEEAYDGLNMMLDDTPGYAQPIGIEERMDAAQEKADELQQVIEELFGDLQTQPSSVEGGGGSGETFLGADIKDYDKVVAAAKKYKQALGDVEKAKEKTSKTLDENGTGQLTFIKQLQESDKQLIAAYEHAADSYKSEWEDYKAKILEAFKEDGKGEKYIQDIMFGNLDPEEWERMITYDSNDQTMKDNVELLERAQTAYDHNKESLKSMREWQQKLNDDIQKEYEMRLNIVKAEMTEIESRMNEAQHDLDMKEILGEVVQEADYQRLINISEEQVANYEKQLDVLNDQLDTLDEGEQAWYDCKSQIADCEQNIRECVKQQAEWNDTILRMPVENISRFLGLIQNLGQTLKNWLSVNDAKGIAQTAEQIQTSWTTAFDQVADDELGLMKQLEDYEELLENYDLGSTKFSDVDDEIQSARDSVEQLVEEMIELNKQLLTIPTDKIAEMTDYLDQTLQDLQAVQSDYETAINTVIATLNDQRTDEEEELENQRKALEKDREKLEKYSESLQKEYDELADKINDSIKPLQDQLKALQEANDKRDRQLKIEEALYALEKAREQRNVQVIRNGRVTYEADEQAIRDAQQGYQNAQYNKLVGDINDEIKAYQDTLDDASEKLADDQKAIDKDIEVIDDQLDGIDDKLEEIADIFKELLEERWETIMPDTQRNRDEEVTTQFFKDMFGVSNWKELVLAGRYGNGVYADEAIYQGTRAGYESNSVQQRDTQRQIDINNLITEQLTRLVEDFQADKINSEELSAKVSTLMNFVNDGLITGQERLENTLSLGDYSNLGAALTDASRQRSDQMDIFNENLAIAQQNRDQVNELIGRWDDFKVWYDETYKQLYEQYKAIDFIGDTLAQWYESDSNEGDHDPDGGVWSDKGPGYSHNTEVYHTDAEQPYFADGLAKGSVGGMTPSDKFKAIQALGLKKLDPDEFPAILHLGEGVINPKQQSTMLGNMRQALALGGAGTGAVVQLSFGDITLPSVTNGRDFAESLATQFQPAMNQVFSKIFRR